MDDLQAFIVSQYRLKKPTSDIIVSIQQNFAMSKENAAKKITEFLNDAQTEMDVNESKKLKIKSNPGFEVLISKEQFTNNINIVVNNINSIGYMKTIPIYLDTLIRLSEKNIDYIDPEFIENMCKVKYKGFEQDKEKPIK